MRVVCFLEIKIKFTGMCAGGRASGVKSFLRKAILRWPLLRMICEGGGIKKH